ncbi:HNH endonuclease [Flavobacterium sp. C4GT6]|uniref:HNH endonuclease n=1 Tax=Flavobacterium sp. C4GT6 TaxID=3103818 RepID=UPI002ED072A1
MPDISNPYIFSREFKDRLEKKFLIPEADYKNWQDDDITDIRSDIRDYYRTEQSGKCAYCNQLISLVSAGNAQVEHIVPKSKHLKFIIEPKNLCVICADCNEIKRNQEVLNDVPDITKKGIKRYPRVSSSFKIIHPHFDKFTDHLLVINGYYIDKTTKGGYTIVFCKLNRKLHKLGYETPIFNDLEVTELMRLYLEEKDSIKRMYMLAKFKKMLILI